MTSPIPHMEFSNPSSEEMRDIFERRLGLVGNPTANRKRGSIIQSALVAKGLLLAMTPPIKVRSPASAYLHPVYARAALKELPALTNFTNELWLEEVEPHLKKFALRAKSRRLIGRAVAAHFGYIAEQTLKLPDTNDELWIPAHTTADDLSPLKLMGVTAERVVQSPHPRAEYRTKDAWLFYRVLGIVEHMALTVPGGDTPETRAAILDNLKIAQAAVGPEKADPHLLFMTARLIINGCEFGASELLGLGA